MLALLESLLVSVHHVCARVSYPSTENADIIKYTSVSGFVFLRFFAPAILNPKLFGLRPENPVSKYL